MLDLLGYEGGHFAGYSLAGLFSIYAGLEWPQIRNVASASGSLWFPGFRTWAEERLDRLEGIYISLGDREARTGNPVLSRVQSESGALYERALALGLRTSFVLEKGGHFNEAQKGSREPCPDTRLLPLREVEAGRLLLRQSAEPFLAHA